MKFYKNIVSFFIIASTLSLAQLENSQDISKVGTTAAQFLKISAGSRGLAMGNANVAIANDLSIGANLLKYFIKSVCTSGSAFS